jgi:pimeloyl-ACP methyl ester carboxylesterase
MELFYRKFGEGPPLIIVHGLYGSSDNWINIARQLSQQYATYLVDQRNHGQSPHSAIHTYDAMRDDLIEFMDRLDLPKAILMGHSMGGKTVMHLAASNPDRVDSLVVLDMSPFTCEPGRHSSQYSLHTGIIAGMLKVDFSQVEKREDVEEQLAGSIPSSRIRSFLMKNVVRNKDGTYRWQLNIEAIADEMDSIFAGLELAGPEAGKGITGYPVLFVRGEDSDYISDDCILEIKQVFPAAEFATIPGAGHWLHVEQPDLLVKTIRYFL